jgi:isopentenyl-diphosphate delta-isomerase
MDRKDSHIAICLEDDVDFYSPSSNGFGLFRFDHDSLPEVDYALISLETELFGKKLAAPLIVGAMTGGTERAGEINRRLALASERCQVGFALGSQRKMLREKSDSKIVASYAVRKFAPKLPLLFGNIGAVQLNYGATPADIQNLIDQVGCDAFNFHLNPLQEAIQPEGDRNFAGLLPKLRECIPSLKIPVLIKEVGSGISEVTANKLKTLPLAGVETAGAGGTSWSKIESLRASDPTQRSTGALFARWGIPTAESVLVCRQVLPGMKLIASGGMRTGIEVAKAIALGADAAAMALPILKAAEISVEQAVQAIETVLTELRTTMFITGISSIEELKKRGTSVLRRAPDLSGGFSSFHGGTSNRSSETTGVPGVSGAPRVQR